MKPSKLLPLFFATLLSVAFTSCSNSTSAEEPEDTFDAAVVCPAQGVNAYGEPNRGTFTDVRDGQVYKYTTVGNQVWMAENLKFDAPYSLCYERTEGFCDTFGRFYSLHVDGEYLGLLDNALVDTICPVGWHVPSVDEWSVLDSTMGGLKKSVTRLYSSSDFGEQFYNRGSDDCGFNALPSGSWLLDGSLGSECISASFWSSTMYALDISYGVAFTYDGISFGINHPKMSIRCLKD